MNSPKDYLTERVKEKDYIVVKTVEEAISLCESKIPSLAGKHIIIAPNGLKFVSKEDIAKLPQVKYLLTSEVEKAHAEEINTIQIAKRTTDKLHRTKDITEKGYKTIIAVLGKRKEQRKALSDIGGKGVIHK